jgi:hypothetical protein
MWVACTTGGTALEYGGGGGAARSRAGFSAVPSNFAFTGESNDFRGSASGCTGGWEHLAYAYDGAVMTMYKNGAMVSAGALDHAVPLTTPASRIFIGYNGNAAWYGGEAYGAGATPQLIDDLRVWGATLTDAQVAALAAAPAACASATPSRSPSPSTSATLTVSFCAPRILAAAAAVDLDGLPIASGGCQDIYPAPACEVSLLAYDPAIYPLGSNYPAASGMGWDPQCCGQPTYRVRYDLVAASAVSSCRVYVDAANAVHWATGLELYDTEGGTLLASSAGFAAAGVAYATGQAVDLLFIELTLPLAQQAQPRASLFFAIKKSTYYQAITHRIVCYSSGCAVATASASASRSASPSASASPSPSPSISVAPCDASGACYAAITAPLSQSDASAACGALGPTWALASVIDSTTRASVMNACAGLLSDCSCSFWSGLYDSQPGTRAASSTDISYQSWRWSSEASVDYLLSIQGSGLWWSYGEPNNSGGSENCALARLGSANDSPCSASEMYPACCQSLPAPTPSPSTSRSPSASFTASATVLPSTSPSASSSAAACGGAGTGAVVTTLVGGGSAGGTAAGRADGIGSAALLRGPQGLAAAAGPAAPVA